MGVLSAFLKDQKPIRHVATVATPATFRASDTQKSQLSQLSQLSQPSGPEIHKCQCGAVAVIGVGWFLREPSRARWFCSECYSSEQT
jgi:hypothetical protein